MAIETIENILSICVFGLLICFVLSLIPFPLSDGWKSWSLYLPIAGTLFFVVYNTLYYHGERYDLALILPAFLFPWIIGIARVGGMIMARRQSYKYPLPIFTLLVLIFTLLAVLGIVLIFLVYLSMLFIF
jgi:hypothetical protein